MFIIHCVITLTLFYTTNDPLDYNLTILNHNTLPLGEKRLNDILYNQVTLGTENWFTFNTFSWSFIMTHVNSLVSVYN